MRVDDYNPSQTITVSEENNVIIITYTLPLTISVEDRTVDYNGELQFGWGHEYDSDDDTSHVTITGLLDKTHKIRTFDN